jgi:transketolase
MPYGLCDFLIKESRMVPTKNPRVSYGLTILEAGGKYRDVVVLTADMMSSFQTSKFAETYPDRFFNVGVAEQNMAGIAAGMATCGKIPFVNTFSVFASMRCVEMLRTDIAYPCLNVKVVSCNAGLAVGAGGTTHHSTEDMAIIRSIANFTLIVPGDSQEIYRAVMASIHYQGPVYIRIGRLDMEDLYEGGAEFQIGKANQLRDGKDITLAACGYMVSPALRAAERLESQKVSARVLNVHTIKPLDEEAILKAARETRGIVVAEEHTVIGGLGGAVAELVTGEYPTQVRRVGINDTFCGIGPTEELMTHHGLTEDGIFKQAMEIMRRTA